MLQRARWLGRPDSGTGFPALLLEPSTMSLSEDESGINDFAPGARPSVPESRHLHDACIRIVLKKSQLQAFNDSGARNEEQTFEKYVRLQR
jgi:hypothetical protein